MRGPLVARIKKNVRVRLVLRNWGLILTPIAWPVVSFSCHLSAVLSVRNAPPEMSSPSSSVFSLSIFLFFGTVMPLLLCLTGLIHACHRLGIIVSAHHHAPEKHPRNPLGQPALIVSLFLIMSNLFLFLFYVNFIFSRY